MYIVYILLLVFFFFFSLFLTIAERSFSFLKLKCSTTDQQIPVANDFNVAHNGYRGKQICPTGENPAVWQNGHSLHLGIVAS